MLRARLLRFGVREAVSELRCAVELPRFFVRSSCCAISVQGQSEEETSVGDGPGAKLVLLEGSSETVTVLSGSA